MGRFKIEEVEISKIRLIDKNARYMEQTDFRALVDNIKRDGELSSVPFCVKYDDGNFTVVSGNHRVEAAKMAGLTIIPVMYVQEKDTSNDEIRAKQLSHNSISGKDDPEILKQLLDEIRDVAFKEYAHISNEILAAVKDIDYTVEMPSNEVVPVTLMFIDTSKVAFDRLMEELKAYTPAELENTIIMDKDYMKRLNEVAAKVSSRFKIKAQALSLCKMVELVDNMLQNGRENTATE